MGGVLSRARPSKTLRAKEVLFDFGAECVAEDRVVVGKQVSDDVAVDPIRDVHDDFEWKVASGMNINYWMDQGFSVRSHAPGDCVWMSRPRRSTV